MKKVILDLDNVLMMFDDCYLYGYSNIINGSYEDVISLYKSIDRYRILQRYIIRKN